MKFKTEIFRSKTLNFDLKLNFESCTLKLKLNKKISFDISYFNFNKLNYRMNKTIIYYHTIINFYKRNYLMVFHTKSIIFNNYLYKHNTSFLISKCTMGWPSLKCNVLQFVTFNQLRMKNVYKVSRSDQ